MTDITVVKLGGKSIETEIGRAQLAARLAALPGKKVIVHGGGAQVTAALANAGIEARFVNGLRVTDEKTLEIAEPVFALIGKLLAHALTRAGAPAVSLSGRDAALVEGHVKDAALGRVGTVDDVNADLLRHLTFNGIVPVVGPIAVERTRPRDHVPQHVGIAVDSLGPLNVNADEVASAVARSLHASDLLLLTDVSGVKGADGLLIPHLTRASASQLIAEGIATGGMIPKIQGALEALSSGVARVRVLDEAGLVKLAAGQPAGTTFTEGDA